MLLFEGPPGGGKSSLSQVVAQQLQAAARPAHWVEEHTLNDLFFAAFFERLQANPAEAIPPLLEGWRLIVDRLHTAAEISCLDGAFFHSSLKLLLAYDADPAQVSSYLQELYGLLAPCAPALIHLTGDVAQITRAAIAERGDQWAARVAADVAQYPCQQRLQQHGVDGLVCFFVESQRQLEAIAATSPFVYYRVDTTARAWGQYEREVCAWLDLAPPAMPSPRPGDLDQYVGTYQPPAFFPPAFNHPFEVERTADGLRLHMVFLRNFRLIEHATDRFTIAGRPAQLEFVRDVQGRITGAIYPFVPDQRFFCEKTM